MSDITAQKTYYDILGVPRNAGDQEIKNAYRRLVSYWHPDARVHDRSLSEHQLKVINEAYANLKTRQMRDRYDRILDLQRKAGRLEMDTPWNTFWNWLTMNESNNK